MTKPKHYQRAGVAFIERRHGRAIIGDELGLGKSLEALLWLNRNPELRPAIIVCPASLKWNWDKEARKHFGWCAEILEGRNVPKRPWKKVPPLIVLNYDILLAWLPT